MNAALNRRGLLLGLTAAAGAGGAQAAGLAKVQESGILRVAVYKDNAPWSFRAPDGSLTGADVEIGAGMARALGAKVDYYEFLADESVEDDLRNVVWRGSLLGGGVADVMLHVPTDKAFAERIEQVLITAPYYRESFVLNCDPTKADCSGLPGLRGATIAVELDSVPDMYLSGSIGGQFLRSVKHYMSGAEAMAALRKGEVAGAMTTRAQSEYGLMGAAGGYRTVGALPGLFRTGWDVGLAVKADARDLGEKLSAILSEMGKSGELAQILGKYGVSRSDPSQA
jgi:polar amino acid transport system substrate-binding protein